MFCILEKDSKTYDYFKRYVDCFESGDSCIEIDNAIQAEELLAHLESQGLSPDNTEAKLSWIAEHGRSFREYLNSIKLVYVICQVAKRPTRNLSPEDFAKLEDEINRQRNCLATMYA